jgi:NADH-quinone oxidoreductase subunit B
MGFEDHVPAGILLTTVETVAGWMRKSSFWPLTMGLACCSIEMISYGGPRSDASRWGQEVFRASPRQADLMIVSGRMSQKMAPVVRRLYDQMPEPKWVISLGACASSGGIFNNYAVVQGGDHIVPVDIYVPGCPPRPDQLIDAMFKLKENLVYHDPMGSHRVKMREEAEREAMAACPIHELSRR